MKFMTFTTEESLNEFLEKNEIKVVDFKRTLMVEHCAYGDNS